MIINLRGTGGAGKSTIVRRAMGCYDEVLPCHVVGRRQPIGYRLHNATGRPLWVVGHYETPCGGTDTITKPDEVYAHVHKAAAADHDVLFEGIIIQDDTRRAIELAQTDPLVVIALEVPIDQCLADIQRRRDARGDARPLNPANTVNRAKRLRGTMAKLQAAGVDARWLPRDEALATVLTLLGVEERQPDPVVVDESRFGPLFA